MKINIIVPIIYKVGGIKTIFEYANEFQRNGHEVIVYSPLIPFNLQTAENSTLHIIRNLPRLVKNFLKFKINVNKFGSISFRIKQVPVISNKFVENAEIILATSWPTAYAVKRLDKAKGKKLYFVQGYEDWDSNSELVDKSYQLGLILVTTSRFLKNFLMVKYGVDSELVFNSINTSIFRNDRRTYAAPGSILFIDHQMKLKNSELAIEVVKEIKKKYSNLNIRSFGHKKIHQMPDYITFYENPPESEIVKLYCDTDIFLFTSDYEGFALPPAEAMSCGCAVVTTCVGAVPEYSRHMFSAIHVKTGDKDSLIEGISFLIENRDKWEYISKNAVLDSEKHLSCFEESVKKFESILEQTLIKGD